ncbi:precorrin-3B C(17)-methyltransferase [Mangrovicoccus sp. HB161399]|uniref:precorrin-3B C(17)-methyltransferase n=1 Tax=Mangrovicoccus sp. HB161399 TaxID=2720392 RepID=UPI0020A67E0A|nr:precorrin-3B C(17)-methyltransferase [Mangrovicoccus sp. HB161399]
MSEPVILSLTQGGAELGDRLAARLGWPHLARADLGKDVPGAIAAEFLAGRPVVAICAAGIVIRALAPFLADKWSDAPVVAVAEDGSAAVPLIGGHHGANQLAARIADCLGIRAALTTGGDVRLGVALDEPPAGWVLDNPADAKACAAALLSGAQGELAGRADWLEPLVEDGRVLAEPGGGDTVVLRVPGTEPLVWRRQGLVLGVGCARGCDPAELIALCAETLAQAGLSQGQVASVASIDVKSDEAAVHALAAHLGVPARFFPAARLEAETPRLANPSDVVFAEVGCHGVSEGAALAAAGEGGTLAVEKAKSANATCALAWLGAGEEGCPRGALAVVGIGPGQASWRTPEASRAIAEAELLVGYGLYIDLLGPLAKGKARADFPLGGEEDRCRFALEEAAKGRRVALVCSGDAGIYAMGALVMELLDRPESAHGVSAAARRVEVVNCPGVSALQAASARAGALLGHDFCTISLSDLLTPRAAITKRIKAAAEGDFVIAFYNPVSMRRRTLLAEARDMLLLHRPADTPVLLASHLGRPDESLRLRRLADLQVDEVDMLTVVLVGASTSRAVLSGDRSKGADGHWLYTPRGYAKKLEEATA